jgi:cutinase
VTTGPALCKGLKAKYGERFGCQGIGGGYKAGLVENVLPKGTDDGAIKEAVSTFTSAAAKCPKSVIVFSGYRSGSPSPLRPRLTGKTVRARR